MDDHPEIIIYYDENITSEKFASAKWAGQVDQIIESIPDCVFIKIEI